MWGVVRTNFWRLLSVNFYLCVCVFFPAKNDRIDFHPMFAFDSSFVFYVCKHTVLQVLCGFSEANQYMSFGLSGSPTMNRMVGADVVVSGVDPATISGFAQDYYLLDKSQCVVQQETGQVSGSCPDSNIQVTVHEACNALLNLPKNVFTVPIIKENYWRLS